MLASGPLKDSLARPPSSRPGRMRVAVVIPTLDEAANLEILLPALVATADEVVVSDGGSRDRTLEVARAAGARTVVGPAGRGPQLNRGARETQAEILLFLHADSRLPEGGLELIREAVAAGADGGGFLLRFDVERPLLELGAWLINRRTRLLGVPLGDQAQFVTRSRFEELGGFRDWSILEDLDFGRRLKHTGRLVVLKRPVTTAARRFLTLGVVRTVATNWLIWALYFAGVSPPRLARLYRNRRRDEIL